MKLCLGCKVELWKRGYGPASALGSVFKTTTRRNCWLCRWVKARGKEAK